jgi:hypothetical protein
MLDETQVHRLAGMAHALRPDWPVKSLVTFIDANLTARAHRDVAVALAYVACDPKSATPKRILEAGPWWRATAVEGNTTRPPKREEACAICGREQIQHGLHAEHDFTDVDHASRDRSNAAHLARAELAQSRASLCTHGVPATACRDHHAAATDDTSGGEK